MSRRTQIALVLAGVLATAAVIAAQSARTMQKLSPAPEFMPDTTFSGSELKGWHSLGAAAWKALNGEITGNPSQSSGGWLVSDASWQDVAFFARMKCEGSCDAGVLLRMQKTAEGFAGVYVSLKEGDLNSYRVTLDSTGKELTRKLLEPNWATIRIAPPPPDPAAAPTGRGGGRGGPRDVRPEINLPTPLPTLARPPYGVGKGDWDQVEIIYDANIVRPYLNNTHQLAPSVTGDTAGYGPVAIHIGGTGAVHFKDVSFKDLAKRTIEPERISTRFRKQQLEEFYYAWGVAVADVNRDGNPDVISGPYYYLGPNFTERHEIYLGESVSPSLAYVRNMVTHTFDFTGDGWPDVLATENRPLVLYVNPRGENRRWERYPVIPQITSEMTVLHDLDGDGRPEVIYSVQGTMAYAKYDPTRPTEPWAVHKISAPGVGLIHGIGVGDVNGDGRPDILGASGWWEQPAKGSTQELWTYHPVAFGRWGRSESPGGGEILVYDVNGDGLPDVVTSLHAHGWGLAWYEQKRDGSFTEHIIMDNYSTENAGGVTFAELHALTIGDVDGDGIPDIITGKRYWSHQDSYYDPDSYGAPVLYWYRTVRARNAPGGASFVPELINNRSGVGSQLVAADLNKDGALDIVTASTRGLFLFFGTKKK